MILRTFKKNLFFFILILIQEKLDILEFFNNTLKVTMLILWDIKHF